MPGTKRTTRKRSTTKAALDTGKVDELAGQLMRWARSGRHVNEDPFDDAVTLVNEIDMAIDDARMKWRASQAVPTAPTTIGRLIARELRDLRDRSGRSQSQLATDMERLGFIGWKRITVAETESGKRRLTWEELLGFCSLFGVPLTTLLGSVDVPVGEAVVLNERRTLTTDQFLAAVFGTADRVQPSAFVRELAEIAGIDEPGDALDWRPVAAMERQRLPRQRGSK